MKGHLGHAKDQCAVYLTDWNRGRRLPSCSDRQVFMVLASQPVRLAIFICRTVAFGIGFDDGFGSVWQSIMVILWNSGMVAKS